MPTTIYIIDVYRPFATRYALLHSHHSKEFEVIPTNASDYIKITEEELLLLTIKGFLNKDNYSIASRIANKFFTSYSISKLNISANAIVKFIEFKPIDYVKIIKFFDGLIQLRKSDLP